MNRLIKIFAFAALLLLPSLGESGVRVYVRFGPPRVKTVKIIKPVKLYRNAIWVIGHYRYRNGRYVYIKGYWIKPRMGYAYIQPHWNKGPRGYYFVPGHWKRI